MSKDRALNRAQEVRRRRARDAAKRQQQATERAYRPLPPVTARAAAYPSTRPQPRSNTRRFETALGLPQTRARLPDLPQGWSGPRLVSLLIALLLGAALYFLWTLPVFHVTEPQVTGAARIPAAEIHAALGLNGRSIFLVQPGELETRLRLTFPELASAQVTIGLPNQVSVRVTERQPIILWQQGEGYTWIDSSGVAFRPHGQADGLILVSALAAPPGGLAPLDDPFSPPPYLAPDIVKAIQVLALNVPPGSVLIYDPRHGLGWNDSRGWQAFFGIESQAMSLKLQVYQSLVDWLMSRNIYPAFISVVHADAPYYRMAE